MQISPAIKLYVKVLIDDMNRITREDVAYFIKKTETDGTHLSVRRSNANTDEPPVSHTMYFLRKLSYSSVMCIWKAYKSKDLSSEDCELIDEFEAYNKTRFENGSSVFRNMMQDIDKERTSFITKVFDSRSQLVSKTSPDNVEGNDDHFHLPHSTSTTPYTNSSLKRRHSVLSSEEEEECMEHDDESIESVSTSSSSSADTRVYIGQATGDGGYTDIRTDGDKDYGTMTGHKRAMTSQRMGQFMT